MRNEILNRITADLLSVPALIFRGVRRKLFKMTLVDAKVYTAPPHFEIMKLLDEAGTLHVAEIGERLQISRAQMTHLIDRLVDLSIVERQNDAADRRMINIMLTDRGKAIVEEFDNNIKKATRETLSCLTDEELETLSDSLEKLRTILAKLQR